MKLLPVLLAVVLLTGWCVRPVRGDYILADTDLDIGHDEDIYPDARYEANGNLPDVNDDMSDTSGDVTYGNAPDTPTDTPPVVTASVTGVDDTTDRTPRQVIRCGEYSSQLMDGGRCRVTATLPPIGMLGTQEKRCPDMFRCTDEVSYWLHENQNRKEQLEDLKETMMELQEELRSHRRRLKTLELQGEASSRLNSSLELRYRALELRQAEAGALLVVHASLLQELQVQLRNLSAAAQSVSRTAPCVINVIRTAPPPLPARDALQPDVQQLSVCPADCAALYHTGVRRSGVYTIVLSPGTALPIYCDMETEGGGWTVFQRRRDGSVSFNRGWSEYRDGFGELKAEHWLGNQQLHLLSNQRHYSLRIDMEDWTHTHRHALYDSFRIEDEENRYRLHVSGFSGTVEDSFGWYHNQQGFSTPDTGNICAEISHAGWWFHQCFYANLNGVYYKGGSYTLRGQSLLGPDGIIWFSWKGSDFYSLKTVSMMIRPRSFRPRLSP
ncbi:angiopoietin-related protein 7-like isoform X2 [Myripristis murdjan]|uniref:angiopoietin-related protein 7-like isoform X2 n=1 Tax=Myripristis murdjan TaxID=586833 RepID=UPI001176318C|nr:angiopoietin-related protein 7-like isoform X2 [Myripristis murdjan]